MPNITVASEQWKTAPLTVVDELFEENGQAPDQGDFGVSAFFGAIIEDRAKFTEVVSLAEHAPECVAPLSLVRCRGMVADCCDKEIFLARFTRPDQTQGHAFYRDSVDIAGVDAQGPGAKYGERGVFYLVPVPGESDWVRGMESGPEPTTHPATPLADKVSGTKHTLDDADTHAMEVDDEATANHSTAKRVRAEEESATGHVVYAETPKACVIKVYSGADDLRQGSMVELVGVLDRSPMAVPTVEEHVAAQPPSLAVPRVHSLAIRILNPALAPVSPEPITAKPSAAEPWAQLRRDIIDLLADCLEGDRHAATYILFHLLSRIYVPLDGAKIGKLSMNLIGCQANSMPRLTATLSQLVPRLVRIPFTISDMNGSLLSPKQDPDTLRLAPGLLLMADHTHVIVDETSLQPGRLDSTGVANMQALQQLIGFQTVTYTFPFYTKDFDCDIPVMVCSHSKSLLTCDVAVRIIPEPGYQSKGLLEQTSQSKLQSLRTYVAQATQLVFTVDEDVQQLVVDDYVEMRKKDAKMSGDALGLALTLARYDSHSKGLDRLDMDVWSELKALEAQRLARL